MSTSDKASKKMPRKRLHSKVFRFFYWRTYHFFRYTIVDWYFGVNTRGVVKGDLGFECAIDKENAQFYEPVNWWVFRKLINQLNLEGKQNFTFLDIGAGKGLALLLAARAGFGRVIGVELSKVLCEQALENIQRSKYKDSIDLVNKDAREITWPSGDLVLFMYNPFVGDMMANFVESLYQHSKSNEGSIYVLYVNDVCHEEFSKRHFDCTYSSAGLRIYRLSKQGDGEK